MNYANHDKIDLRHFLYLLITVIKTSKNSSAKHFQNKKERLQKEAGEKYQSLCKEQKEKKWQYGRERYENLPKDEK